MIARRNLIVGILLLGLLLAIIGLGAVSGAAYTTFNPSVDGSPDMLCKNSIINCNIYSAKEYVWLNGGPTANGLGPDGEYFFAVLVPGGQPNPNDGGPKNLSDDYDCYENRTFSIEEGEVSAYTGNNCGTGAEPHWLDSNTQAPNGCKKGNGTQACDGPDGQPEYIRLFPYADTWNPGGVYIMAICSLEEDYPVDPRDCKYDAFKVKEGRITYDFMLDGYKIHDRDANGDLTDEIDEGITGWEIYINGTGFYGEIISETVTTGSGGFWMYQSEEYVFNGNNQAMTAYLTVCEDLPEGWVQSYPGDPGAGDDPVCHDVEIDPEGVTYVPGLDFGNYHPFDITVCKLTDDYDPNSAPVPYAGWKVWLYQDGVAFDSPQYTGEDGCYTWTDLDPGHSYAVEEEDPLAWVPTGPAYVDFGDIFSGDGNFSHTWTNVPAQGCTPGFWQGGNDFSTAGGQWLWNAFNDQDWVNAGGNGYNPYIWTTLFNSYFMPTSALNGFTMMDLVGTGGGSIEAQKAGRSMVAAYLNATFGIYYAYSTAELTNMWNAAVADGSDAAFLALHTLLDAANNHFGNPDGDCPISASIP